MRLGFDRPLYILPFDYLASFQTKIIGWNGTLTSGRIAEISAAKRIIYDAFLTAVDSGVPKNVAGILVDEYFGADILKDASERGYLTRCPTEKSG